MAQVRSASQEEGGRRASGRVSRQAKVDSDPRLKEDQAPSGCENLEMPVLKQPGPAQPKKRSPRGGALSISAPLGDFRHTLHVGRGGDTFGDTSFLSRHGAAPPAAEPHSKPAGTPPPPPAAPPDPLLSFHLDLGPSMLDAVLGVMDAGRAGAAAQPEADARPGTQPRRGPRSRPDARLELDRGLGL
ncbi:cdc42 effector protein 5 isoform X1 [Heterocephalus glaber]|uniref:Cdc42 effector protein 5 isoform X1 n=2 Tax=Heterocephalus glaber TaxID=10181 RepID=A0AAX6Q7J0_HETGA|nr:cdc42 effector protein 5 isoform X1 [Heterocephalus glaber]